MRLTAKLSEITTVFADWDWIESKDQSSKWIRLIQTWNVWMWNFKDRWDKARYISEETFDRLNCTEIFPNDCLVSRLPDPVWRSCLIPELPDRLITAVDCTIIRFKDTIEPKFFVYYSQSNQYQRDVDILCTWATRKRISRKSLWTIEIPLPPLETQKAIVAKLDQIFAELDQTKSEIQKNLDNTDELWKSALNQAFQGDWEIVKLWELADLQNGYAFKSDDYIEHSKTLNFRMSNIRPWWIVDIEYNKKFLPDEYAEIYKEFLLKNWDVVIAMTDMATSPKILAVPCIVNTWWYNVLLNQRVWKFFNVDETRIRKDFLWAVLSNSKIREWLASLWWWGLQINISKKQILDLKIPVPPLSEQEKIVEHLDRVSKEVKALKSQYQSQLDNLEELKKSVLDKAFRWEMG